MSTVKIYIYDLSKGLAKTMSYQLIGKRLDGIWHSGIVVYNREFFYGSGGIDECDPGGTILGQPNFIEDLGRTELPEDLFRSYLYELSEKEYRGDKYHLFDHNCNNFSDTAAYFLTSRHIPEYVTSLPSEVAGTPLGQMIRTFMDQMQVSKSHPVASAVPKPSTSKQSKQNRQNKNNSATSASFGHLAKDLISSKDRFPSTVAEFSYEENNCKNLEAPMRDIFEYATSTQPLTWGLGPIHFQLLNEIKGEGSPVEVQILELFRFALTRSSDVAIGFARDRGRQFLNLLRRLTAASEVPVVLHQTFLKVVSNWVAQITVADEVDRSPSELKAIVEYCVAVLGGPVAQHLWAAIVAFNLSHLQILEEEEVLGLSSILIHVLVTEDPGEEAATQQHAVRALLHFMEVSSEIRELAIVQGLDVSSMDGADARKLQERLKA